jgi:hypothetical protein
MAGGAYGTEPWIMIGPLYGDHLGTEGVTRLFLIIINDVFIFLGFGTTLET